MAIVKTGTKTLYNLDTSIPASIWIRDEIKGKKTFDAPQMSSGVKIKQKGRGKVVQNYMGYFQNNANSLYYNPCFVSMFSGNFSGANGLSIISENFRKVCALFTARKSVKSTWINQKDEYMAPDETHPDYEFWNNDAIVYALFNTSSNQSSLRDIEYKGKTWQIENEFFWLSPDTILELANDLKQDKVYNDCKRYGKERHVAKLLSTMELSPDARTLLDKATDILKKTMKYRKVFSQIEPKYQINTWDAGWYQVKALAKKYAKSDFEDFNKLYKEFENRMRQGVVTFGFLYNI